MNNGHKKKQNRKNLNLNKVSYIHFNVIRIIHFLLLLFGLLLLQEPNTHTHTQRVNELKL